MVKPTSSVIGLPTSLEIDLAHTCLAVVWPILLEIVLADLFGDRYSPPILFRYLFVPFSRKSLWPAFIFKKNRFGSNPCFRNVSIVIIHLHS